MKTVILVIITLLSFKINAQKGFKTSINIHPGEPNSAYQVEECNGRYIISGQYFDTIEGYWLPFIAEIDLDGNLIGNEDSYIFTGNKRIQVIFEYNFDTKAINIIDRFKFLDLDVSPSSFLISDDHSKIYYCGRNIPENDPSASLDTEVAVILLSKTDTVIYRNGIPGKSQIAKNMRFNSEGNLVVAAYSDEGWIDSTFIMIFDPELNLISSTSQTSFEANFSYRDGLAIDHEDNIICTGGQVTKPNGVFDVKVGAAKFNSQGQHLWTAGIGNHVDLVNAYPDWNAVIESPNNDGYVLVGAKTFQTPNLDTSILIPSIAKLSSDGDSLWHYTYSYRFSKNIRESFHDVISTSDGGYLAIGDSTLSGAEGEDLPWVQSILLKVNADGLLDTTSVAVLEVDNESLNIYPNPSSDIIYLKQKNNQHLDIKIYDLNGKVVDTFISYSDNHTVILDVSNYNSGIYTLIAHNKVNKNKYTSRFTKL